MVCTVVLYKHQFVILKSKSINMTTRSWTHVELFRLTFWEFCTFLWIIIYILNTRYSILNTQYRIQQFVHPPTEFCAFYWILYFFTLYILIGKKSLLFLENSVSVLPHTELCTSFWDGVTFFYCLPLLHCALCIHKCFTCEIHVISADNCMLA